MIETKQQLKKEAGRESKVSSIYRVGLLWFLYIFCVGTSCGDQGNKKKIYKDTSGGVNARVLASHNLPPPTNVQGS